MRKLAFLLIMFAAIVSAYSQGSLFNLYGDVIVNFENVPTGPIGVGSGSNKNTAYYNGIHYSVEQALYSFPYNEDAPVVNVTGQNTSKVLHVDVPGGCEGPCSNGAIEYGYEPYESSLTEFYYGWKFRTSPDFDGGPNGGKTNGFTTNYNFGSLVKPDDWHTDSTRYTVYFNFDNGTTGQTMLYIYDRYSTYYASFQPVTPFHFIPNTWYQVTLRVNLGTPMNADGFIQLFINGKCIMTVTGMSWRGNMGTQRLDKLLQTFFFGGAGASPKDQWIEYDDMVLWTYTSYAISQGLRQGQDKYQIGDVIPIPGGVYNTCWFNGETNSWEGCNIVDLNVTGLSGTKTGTGANTYINLTFNDLESETSYEIARKEAGGSYSTICTLPSNTNSYDDHSVTSNNTYYYKVRAFYNDSVGEYCPEIQVSTSDNDYAAYWQFDNNGNDASGNNHNAAFVNGATYTSGKTGNAVQLNGTQYGNAGIIDLGNQFTIATWVYIPSWTYNIQTIISNQNNRHGFSFYVNTYGTSDGTIRFETANGSSSINWVDSRSGQFTFNQWTHLAVVVDKTTNQAKLYCNGTEVTYQGTMVPGFDVNTTINIGRYASNQFYFNGNLDELKLYTKKLSASEIYNLAHPGTQYYTLTINKTGNGTVTPAEGTHTYSAGTSVVLSATEDAGYTFAGWTGSVTEASKTIEIIMNSDKNVTANFSSQTYSLTIIKQGTGSGTLTPSEGTYYFNSGESVTLTATPASGSVFNGWNGSVSSSNSTITCVMDRNITETATFDLLPSSDIIAEWPVNNSFNDISGNGHNLNPFNGLGFSSVQKKEGSHSISFDGYDDYANAGTMNLGNEFSISLWAYIPTWVYNMQTLISNMSGNPGNGFSFYVNSYGQNDRMIRFETGNGIDKNWVYSSQGKFVLGQWNQLVAVVNKNSNTAKLYYNGVEATLGGTTMPNFSTNAAINLGRYADGRFYMSGNLDNIKIYNRQLSAAEIQTLYNDNKSAFFELEDADFNAVTKTIAVSDGAIKKAIVVNALGSVMLIKENTRIEELKNEINKFKSGVYYVKIIDTRNNLSTTSIIKK